jgi:GNAT superfamily N-acetyltransferase
MDEEAFYDEIYPIPRGVEAEPVLTGTKLQIGHFKVPEDNQGNGIGEEVMEWILEIADEYGVEKVDVNIAYTLAPEKATRKNDPTVKFLQNTGFTVDVHKNTVSGAKNSPL